MPNYAKNPYLDIKSSTLEPGRRETLERVYKEDESLQIEWKDITTDQVKEECEKIDAPHVPVFKQLVVNRETLGVVTCSLYKDVATPLKHYNYWIRGFEKDKTKVYVSWLKNHVRNYHAKTASKTAEKRKASEESDTQTVNKKMRGQQPILQMRNTKLTDEKKKAVQRVVAQALCDFCIPLQQMENLTKSLIRSIWELAGGDLAAYDTIPLSRDTMKRFLIKEKNCVIANFAEIADTLAKNGMLIVSRFNFS